MRIGVLGPIEVVADDGRAAPVPAAKERALLAALTVVPGRVVPCDALVEALWGDAPPRTARKTLQTYVLHLRRLLGDRLVTAGQGYRLDLAADELDAQRFEADVAAGRLALLRGLPGVAAELLSGALGLWRGEPWADVPATEVLDAERRRLTEMRATALEDHLEARLLAGDHRTAVAELEALVREDPLRERRSALLMRALYAEGRQAEALRAFQRARAALVEELGVEPGPQLRALEAAILSHDPSLHAGSAAPPVRYVRAADDLRIACCEAGEGPPVTVFLAEWTFHLEMLWEIDELRPLLDQLVAAGRLVVVQRRGTGLSDRQTEGFAPPEACVDDLVHVLDELGLDAVDLVGWGHGGQLALAFAARRPGRVRRIAVVSGYASLTASSDHPDALSPEAVEAFLMVLESMWGREVPKHGIFHPDVAADPALVARISRIERLSATPRNAVEIQRAVASFDVTPLLDDVTCDVLVVGLTESVTGLEPARSLATRLANGVFVELPGHFVPRRDETAGIASVIVDFLAEGRRSAAALSFGGSAP